MSMRVHKLTTYLQADEAYTLIEFLDLVREVLMQAYGDEIRAMLQQASAPAPPSSSSSSEPTLGDEDPFQAPIPQKGVKGTAA